MGPVASKVLFENDRVKIWNLIVEPHTHQNWHHHPRDYVTICVAHGEDAIGVEYESGETGPFPSKVGDVVVPRRRPGGPQRAPHPPRGQQHGQALHQRSG